MEELTTELILASLGGMMTSGRQIGSVLALNEQSAKYDLTLTEAQAKELLETRSMMLKETEMIEFGGGTVENIIKAFCDSPYLDRRNYETSLHTLIELYYTIKDETGGIMNDADTVDFLKTCFNGVCGGSLEALEGDCVPKLLRHINNGGKYNSFRIGNYIYE